MATSKKTAKKKVAKKKDSKKKQPADAGRQSAKTLTLTSAEELTARIARLERRVARLSVKPVPAAATLDTARLAVAPPALLGLDARTGDPAQVVFEKSDSSPELVRIEFKNHPDVLSEGQKRGTINNVRIGDTVFLWIHVTGNPGEIAQIKLTGTYDESITVKLITGQRSEPRHLFVTG